MKRNGPLPGRAIAVRAPTIRDILRAGIGAGCFSILCATVSSDAAAQLVREERRGTAVGIAIELEWPSARAARVGARAVPASDSALARAVARAGRAFSDWSAATVPDVECDAHGLRASFAVTPARWGDALRIWARTLADTALAAAGAPTRATVPPGRGGIGPLANPSREFDALLRRARHPAGAAEPPCELSVEESTSAAGARVNEPPARPMSRVRARVAVYGPVDPAGAAALLASLFETPRQPLGLAGTEPPVPRRLVLERSTVSAWIGLSHAVRQPTPAESLHLLAHRLEERLRASIGREILFDVQAAVVRGADLDWLQLRMLVDAGAAADVERAAREVVAATAIWAIAPADFAALRDRFRGARLRSLDTPERRAREALLNPVFAAGELTTAIDRLESGHLEAAARAIGPPAVVVVGPR